MIREENIIYEKYKYFVLSIKKKRIRITQKWNHV